MLITVFGIYCTWWIFFTVYKWWLKIKDCLSSKLSQKMRNCHYSISVLLWNFAVFLLWILSIVKRAWVSSVQYNCARISGFLICQPRHLNFVYWYQRHSDPLGSAWCASHAKNAADRAWRINVLLVQLSLSFNVQSVRTDARASR